MKKGLLEAEIRPLKDRHLIFCSKGTFPQLLLFTKIESNTILQSQTSKLLGIKIILKKYKYLWLCLKYSNSVFSELRDWSLITGRGGGLQNGRGGGHVKFDPYEKGGAEKVLAILKGGAQQVLG